MARSILSWVLWPFGIAMVIASVLYFGDARDSQATYGVIGRAAFGALIVLTCLELVLPYRDDWKLRGDRNVWRNLGHAILFTQLGGFLAVYLVVLGLAPLIAQLHLPTLWPTHSPLIVQILLVMVVGDGLLYWFHRLSHRVPALWTVHAIHHMPVRLNMFMAGRQHVLYQPLGAAFVWVPLLLIGTPPELYVWQYFSIIVAGNIDHANIAFRVPRFMHRVIVTPQYHRLHHSAHPVHGNSNFGVMLPLWDQLFGTFVDPATTELRAAGIEGDPIPNRFLVELAWPFNLKRWKRTAQTLAQ